MFKISKFILSTTVKNGQGSVLACLLPKLNSYPFGPQKIQINYLRLCQQEQFYEKYHYFTNYARNVKATLALSILTWLGFTKDDEEKDSELIMTLKRSVLCMQREQYEKAEQMLHLALRIAQQQQNQQGVLYCYDLMANLAFDQLDLEKAEKLFVSVLQMLLGNGAEQHDLKVIHISLKLARISQLKADIERAQMGYDFCFEKIGKHKGSQNTDAKILEGVINDWYAQFLLDIGDVKKSLVHLNKAYDICKIVKGYNSEQCMLLLNDLGITSFRAGNLDAAQSFLQEAIAVGRNLDDQSYVGVINANLGLILLEKGGFLKEATKYCKEAWRLGKKHDNSESMQQANY